MQKKEETDG